jgi:hypothetical protein
LPTMKVISKDSIEGQEPEKKLELNPIDLDGTAALTEVKTEELALDSLKTPIPQNNRGFLTKKLEMLKQNKQTTLKPTLEKGSKDD